MHFFGWALLIGWAACLKVGWDYGGAAGRAGKSFDYVVPRAIGAGACWAFVFVAGELSIESARTPEPPPAGVSADEVMWALPQAR